MRVHDLIRPLRRLPPDAMGWLAASFIGFGAVVGLPVFALLMLSVAAAAQAKLSSLGELGSSQRLSIAGNIRAAAVGMATITFIGAVPFGEWVIGVGFMGMAALLVIEGVSATLDAVAARITGWRTGDDK